MNKFMISDASYCDKLKKAGLGVIDTFSGKKYSMNVENINNSIEAEYIALVYAVKIALLNKYTHVVFVYDCKGIDLTNLTRYLNNKFLSFQFLWMQRDYTKQADQLAKKALRLARSLTSLNLIDVKKMNKKEEKEYVVNIIKSFSSYTPKDIINACMYSATKKEKEILNIFLKDDFDIYDLPEYKFTDVHLFRFIYHMLPYENRAKFYGLITAINPFIIRNKKFMGRPKNVELKNKINEIMTKIKTIKTAA